MNLIAEIAPTRSTPELKLLKAPLPILVIMTNVFHFFDGQESSEAFQLTQIENIWQIGNFNIFIPLILTLVSNPRYFCSFSGSKNTHVKAANLAVEK